MSNLSHAPLKTCTKCKQNKPATPEFFNRDSGQTSGLRPDCKECRAAYSRRYFEANRDKILAQNKVWQEANPERYNASIRRWQEANPDKVKAAHQRTVAKHRGQINAQSRAYRWAHIEEMREYDRQYSKANREKKRNDQRRYREQDPNRYRAYCHNYRAQKGNGGKGVSAEDIKSQYDTQSGRCFWCSLLVGDSYHVDHVIPLSRGGLHQPDNIVIACPSCNMRKHDKLPLTEWKPPKPLA